MAGINRTNLTKYGTAVVIAVLVTIVCCLLGINVDTGAVSDVTAAVDARQSVQTGEELLEQPGRLQGRSEQIIHHTGYTVSYNSDWCIPNWVAYELTAEETRGENERCEKFEPDPDVKGRTAYFYDYNGSGYDRGHMAPAGDMKWSGKAMYESFYLSNICPQDKDLNHGDWNDLENRIRGWARKKGPIYVVCGPLMEDNPKRIGKNKVAVPAGFFKAVLRRNSNGEYTAIAFVFRNKAGHNKLSSYACTIDEVEDIAKMDLFPALDDRIETKVESVFNLSDWNL